MNEKAKEKKIKATHKTFIEKHSTQFFCIVNIDALIL